MTMYHLQSSALNKVMLVVRVLRGVLLNVCVNIDLLVLTLYIIGIIAPDMCHKISIGSIVSDPLIYQVAQWPLSPVCVTVAPLGL